MKFIKLKIKNFLPYCGDSNEIVLFEKNNRNKNVTLNIGPTGNGKTSISRAVMWCLFGESYEPKWEYMVNNLSIEIGKQTHQKFIKTSIELEVEIEGKNYLILREGTIDIGSGKRADDTTPSIRYKGEPIKEPEKFVNENFLPVNLMEYFIFDADDMLSLFEKNQERTVKDHINKIVGVETLDIMSATLQNVVKLYGDEIQKIQLMSPGIQKGIVDQEIQKRDIKKQAIDALYKQKHEYEKQKNGLFPKGHLSPEELKLNDVIENIRDADKEINELNINLESNPNLISNLHLLFLKEIIEQTYTDLKVINTTKGEFDSAIDVLKSTLEGKYSGILIDDDQTKLIRRGIKIKDGELDTAEKLVLNKGTGIKTIALQEMNEYGKLANETYKDFTKIQENFNNAFSRLAKSREILKQIGDTEDNKKLKEKIEKFLAIDKNIQELQPIIEKAEKELKIIEEGLEKLTHGFQITEENQRKIDKINNNIQKTEYIKTVVDKSKKIFLKDLLDEVNGQATKFFIGVKKGDDPRLNSIEVDSDYKLNVKNNMNETIDPQTISKGNTQIALMAFFFGLSKYLENKLPYIIDDPLIRLDIGHDKRLIQHLCNSEQQIIMHLIPGKEYTEYSYKWLKPFINTQNWINRKRENRQSIGMLCSYSEIKDPSKFVEFDIDKL